jgi:hypothetical protein
LRDGEEEESRCAANPRAGAGDAAKTLRVTKGRDDGAMETDEDKIWWAMGFSCGSNPYTKCNSIN